VKPVAETSGLFYRRLSAAFSLLRNPEGCQIVAGGRHHATSGESPANFSCTLEGCQTDTRPHRFFIRDASSLAPFQGAWVRLRRSGGIAALNLRLRSANPLGFGASRTHGSSEPLSGGIAALNLAGGRASPFMTSFRDEDRLREATSEHGLRKMSKLQSRPEVCAT
jgi:hypothetical protein